MRLVALLFLTSVGLAVGAAGPVWAQQVGMIGPSFAPSAVTAGNFDTVFEIKVTVSPTVPVLWNQTPEARFDAVVCNIGKANRGGVKADPNARWGYLDPNVCTMFANIHLLDLTPIDGEQEWPAKIFLRSHR